MSRRGPARSAQDPSRAELVRLVASFKAKRLLTVADLVADEFVYGQVDRVSREAPVLILRYQRADLCPGGGANAVHNIRTLGGAPLPLGTYHLLDLMGFTVCEGYGLTETSPALTFNPLSRPRGGTVGPALPGARLKIADPDENGVGEVPIYLRDKTEVFRGSLGDHYRRTQGEHEGYKNPHAYAEGWVEQQYLPDGVDGGWFRPRGRGYERTILERLKKWKLESND